MKKIPLIIATLLIFSASGCKNHISPAPILGNLRLVKTEMQTGGSVLTVSYEYNSNGSFSAITSCYDAAKTDCERSVYGYDAGGRVSEVNTYDNLNALENKAVNIYDAAGIMTSTENTSYVFTPASTITYTYTHDAAGNTTSITDSGLSAITTFEYDAANRMTRQLWSGGTYSARSWDYIYDAGGLLIRVNFTDSFGGPHTYHALYEYDAAGKKVKYSTYNDFPGNGDLARYSEYYYDTYGNISYELQKLPDGTLSTRIDYTYEAVY